MTSKERAEFRAQANSLEPLFQIGKGGMSEALVEQTANALRKRELIKLKVLLESAPESPKELATKIAEATGCDIVQVIGGTIVVFRINLILRQKEAEKKKRQKEKARREAIERRTERNRRKYSR